MSRHMDRIRREAMEQYGDAPATPEQTLAHVLKVYADEPDDRLMIEATNEIYGDGIRTGLTMGDLRGIAASRAELDASLLARAIEAARDEYLTDATGDETGEAYNRGVADAIAAIGALGKAPQ